MKVYRTFFYLLMAAALFYGLYSGNRVCYLLFIIQLITVLTAVALNLWTISSFSYVQKLSVREAEKGQTVTLHLGIYNDKPFPFTDMKVHIETPAKQDRQDLLINLAPHQEASYDFVLTLPYRGEFMVGMTRLDIQDLFGLFPMHIDMRWLSYYHQISLLVYPRLIELLLPAPARTDSGSVGAAFTFSPSGRDELSHLRAYQLGDSLSRIHWKASIKTRSLVTRQYEDPSGGSCLIFLDSRAISTDSEVLSDRITECATAIIYAHLSAQNRVQLACQDTQYPQVRQAYSLAGFSMLHQWLAMLPFRTGEAVWEALHIQLEQSRPDCLFLIGCSADEQLLQSLDGVPVPCYYWVAQPLPESVAPAPDHVRLASFNQTELETFLSLQLEGGRQ